MTFPFPSADEPQRLARALLARAVHSLPALADAPRAEALLAIDLFVDRPTPSSFLAAHRALGGALRARFADSAAPRRFARGLDGLRTAGLDPAVLTALESLPRDGHIASRLDALGALCIARHELTGRAASAAAMLRARFPPEPKKTRR